MNHFGGNSTRPLQPAPQTARRWGPGLNCHNTWGPVGVAYRHGYFETVDETIHGAAYEAVRENIWAASVAGVTAFVPVPQIMHDPLAAAVSSAMLPHEREQKREQQQRRQAA